MHFVSPTLVDLRCRCGRPAAHRVGEEYTWDHPELNTGRPLTADLCCRCFMLIFGNAAGCEARPCAGRLYQI